MEQEVQFTIQFKGPIFIKSKSIKVPIFQEGIIIFNQFFFDVCTFTGQRLLQQQQKIYGGLQARRSDKSKRGEPESSIYQSWEVRIIDQIPVDDKSFVC